MNQKTIIRLLIAVAIAVVGALQFKGPPPAGVPAGHHKQSGGQQNSERQTAQRERSSNEGSSQGRDARSNSSRTVGDFDYYLISLSWSPTYCLSHPNDKRQCGGRGFGFVLHGLWPQKSSGGYPEDCGAGSPPSPSAVQKALAFMPSERLIQHEWAKHGSCTGLSGDEYLSLADRAYAVVRMPAAFNAPVTSRTLTPEQILAEMGSANPGLPTDSLTLKCSGGDLKNCGSAWIHNSNPEAAGKVYAPSAAGTLFRSGQ